ncbi:MAG: hypothetical protein WAT23_14430 [Chromatiaceae bacterium]
MSHRPTFPKSSPPILIPEQASLGTDKGSRVLLWISGVGLVVLLIAVIAFLWKDKPDAQGPRDAVTDSTLSQPIPHQ